MTFMSKEISLKGSLTKINSLLYKEICTHTHTAFEFLKSFEDPKVLKHKNNLVPSS